jgi:hypothetical protein
LLRHSSKFRRREAGNSSLRATYGTRGRPGSLPSTSKNLTIALAGLGAAGGSLLLGAVVGIVGAVIGTLGGRTARARLAAALGRDPPAALIEDAVAILAALLIVMAIP